MPDNGPVLVVGATGLLGGEICRRLADHVPVRALVRATSDEAKVVALRALGAETVEGDLKDRSSLDRASSGVSVVVSTATSTVSRVDGDTIESVDRDGQLSLVDAAAAARVQRFVFVSFIEFGIDAPLERAKRTVERRIVESGLAHTILRPSNFMEVWLGPFMGFDAANGTARVCGDGSARLNWVSFVDVARQAVDAALTPDAPNATVDCGGPDALSALDVVRIYEEESGRPFAVEHVPEEALEAQLGSAADSLEQSFAALMLGTARAQPTQPAPVGNLTTVREFVRAQR